MQIGATGLITGTPTVTGTFPVTITVTDKYLVSATMNYSLVINSAPTISTGALPGGEQTVNYSATLAAANGTTPFSWAANGLPAGLTISSGGLISGKPTVAGSFSVNVTVSDSGGGSAQQTFALNIISAPTTNETSLPGGQSGVTYSGAALSGSGGVSPYTWTASGLPTGLTMTSGGVISGTPTQTGTRTVTITILDSNGGTTQKNLSITIGTAPSITTASLPSPRLVGQAYPNTTLAGSGGTPPYTWSVSGLPPGLSFDSTTLVISGTPTASGPYSVVVMLTDSVGGSASKTFPVSINALPTVATATPTPRGQGAQGQVITINGSGFQNGATVAFSSAGVTLASGVTFVNAGQLRVTVNISGSATVGAGNVTVTNPDTGVGVGTGVFTVTAGPKITSINPTSHSRNQTFNITVTGTGFVSGATFAFSGPGGAPSINTTTFTNSTTMTINVSAGNTRTTWNLTVTNPDGGTSTLNNAYTSTF
jgi:hypothetical protein